jgi:predicted secreted protein
MPYIASQAQYGRGTVLAIGSTPTTVAEIKTIKLSGRKWDTEDTTNLQSSAKEFMASILDNGEWDLEGNRVSADAGQTAMEAAFVSGALSSFTITLPKTGAQTSKGDSWSFSAVITELDYSIDVTKAISFSCKLKISGTMTMTAGS